MLVKEIGHGSFSRVFEAVPAAENVAPTSKSSDLALTRVAIKVIPKLEDQGQGVGGGGRDSTLSRSSSTASFPHTRSSSSSNISTSSSASSGSGSSRNSVSGGVGITSTTSTSVAMSANGRSQRARGISGGSGLSSFEEQGELERNEANNDDCGDALEDVQRILDHETQIWSMLNHPNILAMYDVMDVDVSI